jgi:L-fuconolactonase
MIVDAHFHIWLLARGDYGWLTPALGAIHRDVAIDDWRRVAAPPGVQGGVLVQAAPTEAETQFLLAAADAEPCVLGVVGWTDLLAPDAPARIAGLARHAKLKGLRPMLQDIADAHWILQPALTPALQAMADHDLVFDALIRPQHLPRVRELARCHPALRIVVDHAAKPEIALCRWQPWADELRRLADETSAVCKLSGLLTEARPEDGVESWVRHVLDVFGPERVLWASDWPVLELAGSYERWWQLSRDITAAFSESERQAIFGGNACREYRLAARDGTTSPQGITAGSRAAS